MSMNQTEYGQERIFVILKSALKTICEWRDVNIATGPHHTLGQDIWIDENKWINYDVTPEDYIAIINCQISDYDTEHEGIEEFEYCPSYYNQKLKISRSRAVKTQFMTENMEYFDLWVTDTFLSRVWQHENDHLDGIHFIKHQQYHQESVGSTIETFSGEDIELSKEFQKVNCYNSKI